MVETHEFNMEKPHGF